jgi:hypothetical protein
MAGSNIKRHRKAFLYCLETALGASLAEALGRCGCRTLPVTGDSEPRQADIVFCPYSPEVLKDALARFRNLPVVVVSRLPEVDGWLDALEAGAADYCAAPFEAVQISWLLDNHARGRKALAAA